MNANFIYPIACVFYSLSTLPAHSDQLNPETQPFNEELRASAQISGARFVGLAAVAPTASKTEPSVTAFVPETWAADDVCLRVMSADGRYQSENSYSLELDWPGGSLVMDYPTRYGANLAEFGRAIAVLLTKGRCDAAVEEATSVKWGEQDSGAPLSIVLNTARADETYLFFPERSDLPDVMCERSDAPILTAFDTICPIPVELLEPRMLEAVVVSFKNGELGSETSLKINLFANQ